MKITIFTPTYNRKNLLMRLYESLSNQTCLDFEWLIIDDGSTDNTKSLVDTLKEKANFCINYYYKENGGKPSAYNLAVKKCNTEYFFIVDSDDIISNNAIEILYSYIVKIDKNENVSGIIGNKGDINTKKIIGDPMPKIEYAKGLELYQKFNFHGETLRVYKTNILKNILFPEIPNEKFIPENYIFDKIDLSYDMLVIKEVLYYYEYQSDGYSNSIYKIRHNNPIGYSLALMSLAEASVVFKKKINYTILFIIWCMRFRIKGYCSFSNKLLYIICLPVAVFLNILRKPKFLFRSIEWSSNEK